MGHYDRKQRDCTEKGHKHTWSDLKSRNVSHDVIYVDGDPFLKVTWEAFRCCETEMEYHAGRNVGMSSGQVCECETDIEQCSSRVSL